MKKPFFSIVMPTFNHGKFIDKAIRSVLEQDYEDFELIISNNCSTDNTDEIVQKYINDKRIKYWVNDKNIGMLANGKKCVLAASGEYVNYLGSDDFLMPGHLRTLREVAVAHPEIDVIYSNVFYGNEDDLITSINMHHGLKDYCYYNLRDEFPIILGYGLHIKMQSSIIRTSLLKDYFLSGNSDSIVFGLDTDIFLSMAAQGAKFAYINKPLAVHRRHGGGHSDHKVYHRGQHLIDNLTLWENYLIDQYAHRLMGYEHALLNFIEFNLQLLRQYPKDAAKLLPKLMPRIEKIKHTVVRFEKENAERPISKNPLVSVVIPTKNRPELLQYAIKSLLEQTYENWQAIVVNDGGCDVESLIRSLDPEGKKVHYVSLGVSKGPSGSRNVALSLAQGEIITYLDDDDVYLPNHLEKVVERIVDGAAVVFTQVKWVIEKIENGRRIDLSEDYRYINHPHSNEDLLVQNYITMISLAHRKSCLQKIGGFDERLTALVDWDLILSLSKYYLIERINDITVVNRTRAFVQDNVSRNERKNFVELFERIYAKFPVDDESIKSRRAALLQQLINERAVKNTTPEPVTEPPDLYTTYLTRHRSPFHPDDPLPADSPVVTFVVPCSRAELPLLADTLDSLGVQSAPLWRLVVLADAPAPDAMWDELPMLRWRALASLEEMGEALGEELEALASGWVSVLAPGVRLAADAVEQLVRHALAFPQWRLMYGDSDTVEADGTRRDPLFRPDVNLDLLRSMPYLGPCLWVEREAFAAVGGLGECGEAWRYDLALRVLDAFGEEAIGHVDEVLYSVPAGREEGEDESAHRQALAAHLARRELDAEVAEGYVPGTWRVVYRWPRQPRVSIVIPTKDQADYLQSCVESIRAKTNYPDYEILVVDNGSTQPEACAYLERLRAEGVRVLPYPKPFNFSAMCNLAAREASGEYLLLLNNDTAVLQEHWLERMVAYGQRPDVGIVGVKLMFPQPPTVQHVGVILGLGGIAEHPYLGLLGLTDGGYMNRALVDQDLSAVTAACLLIRKSVWEEVKGLDEQAFRVSYNDVDLCLKVRERGYKILWTPFVVLVHHGSVSQQQEAAEPAKARKAQQRFGKEQEAMLRKWLPQLARDPAYNRHLSLTHRDYRVESEIVVNWDPRLPSEKVRVLGWEQLSGVIEYRIKQPLEGLWQARAAERSFIHAPGVRQTRIPLLVEVERAKPDVFTASAFLELSDHLETVRQVQEIAGIPFLLHLDDLISEIPRQSEVYEHRNTPGEMKRLVRTADRVVVTTEPIRAAIEKYAREVRLIPNYLPGWVWNGLKSERRAGPKPRVGWAGAMQHAGDLALIREVVEATRDECDWVFFGMCPEELRPFVKEFHPFVPFEEYPAKLASLDLDLAVAPLEVNRFNECKSNLRLLEYGILGWPVVCSDVLPYRGAPVARVPNRTDAWLEAIRVRIHDLDAAQKEGEALRQWVREGWMLEDHLDEWLEAYRLGL